MSKAAAIAALINNGDYPAAVTAGREAMAAEGEQPPLLLLVAIAEACCSRIDTSLQLAERLLAQTPPQTSLAMMLANTLIRLQRLEPAAALCRRILAVQPDNADAREQLDALEKALSPFRGNLDAVDGRIARGWCWNSAEPGSRTTVEILEDDRVIATGLADLDREDLARNGIGDGRHGFAIPLPIELVDGRPHRIGARPLGGGTLLLNGPITAVLSSRGASLLFGEYEGVVDGLHGRRLEGWIHRPARRGEVVAVAVSVDGVEVAVVPSDRYRADLAEIGHNDGYCAFSVELPLSVFDGETHRIVASVAGTDLALPGSPHTVSPPMLKPHGIGARPLGGDALLPGGPITAVLSPRGNSLVFGEYEGVVDGLHGRRLEGWIHRPARRGEVVAVAVSVDGVEVAVVPADRYRADLAEIGHNDGYCAFSVELPLSVFDGETHRIVASVAGTDLALPGSPHTVSPLPVAGPPAVPAPAANSLPETVRHAAPGLDDYIVFPIIDWDFRFQRPQQIATVLARQGHRVFYLTLDFLPEDAPGDFVIRGTPEPGVFLVSLCCPSPHPVIYADPFTPHQGEVLTRALDRMRAAYGIVNPVALVQFPMWRPVVNAMTGTTVVFDCLDHFAGFANVARAALAEEQRLLLEADLVVTSSAGLSAEVGRDRDNLLVRNAADHAFFATPPQRTLLLSEKPVIGYIGAIAEWFDIDLLTETARRHPEWVFVLIGATTGCDTASARDLPNVHFLGEIPYAAIKGYLYGFDVCIIPFKRIELTRHTNPVKVYEYLSAGKPVVATPLPELEEIGGDLVRLAGDPDAFSQALREAMGERHDTVAAARRRSWASGHSWTARVDRLKQGVTASRPQVSVIVLAQDDPALTRSCLTSLLSFTGYPQWELLLVAAGHDEGTLAPLNAFADRHRSVRAVLDAQGTGLSGVNAGLREAQGEFVVLLDGDTFVTLGWLNDLVRHLRITPDLGLIGPVTNAPGGEAAIPIAYASMEEMAEKARNYTSVRFRRRLFTNRITFSCVAMARALVEEVGPLSEDYGLPVFQSDDYCNRVRAAGYSIAIAEDVFVHRHPPSTDRSGPDRAVFERDRALYESRWGGWQPHRARGTGSRGLWFPFNAA